MEQNTSVEQNLSPFQQTHSSDHSIIHLLVVEVVSWAEMMLIYQRPACATSALAISNVNANRKKPWEVWSSRGSSPVGSSSREFPELFSPTVPIDTQPWKPIYYHLIMLWLMCQLLPSSRIFAIWQMLTWVWFPATPDKNLVLTVKCSTYITS